jgi:hypothetical protein
MTDEKLPKRTPIFVPPSETLRQPSLEVPTEFDDYCRPSEPVKAENPEAASQWDCRNWRPVN